MGVYDRDYMRESSGSRNSGVWIIIVIVILVVAVALINRSNQLPYQQYPLPNSASYTPPFYKGKVQPAELPAIWARIKTWHDKNTPKDTLCLAPGATDEQLDALEKTARVKLPEIVRASYRLYNGTDDTFLLYHGPLLSVQEIVKQHRMYTQWQRDRQYGRGMDFAPMEVRGPIKPIWWSHKRIMLTDNSGDHVFLDLDPPANGTMGQIFDFSHEVGPTDILATDFGAWLQGIADDLESGRFIYDPNGNWVIPKAWNR